MARKVQVLLVDDLDGKDADETVKFGLDGTSYEIDLSAKNAQKLRDALAPFVAAGRRSTAGRRRRSSTEAAPAQIRAWARENGHEVPARGRIPAEIKEAYAAAN